MIGVGTHAQERFKSREIPRPPGRIQSRFANTQEPGSETSIQDREITDFDNTLESLKLNIQLEAVVQDGTTVDAGFQRHYLPDLWRVFVRYY